MSQLQKARVSQKKLNSRIFDDTNANLDFVSDPIETVSDAESPWLIQAEVKEMKAELKELGAQLSDMILRTNGFIKNQTELTHKLLKQDEILNHRDQKIVETFNDQIKSMGARVGPLFDQEERTRELISQHMIVLNKLEQRLAKQETALIQRDAQISFLQSLIREMQKKLEK